MRAKRTASPKPKAKKTTKKAASRAKTPVKAKATLKVKAALKAKQRPKKKVADTFRRNMALYFVKYLTINPMTELPSGTSGTVISAPSVSDAKYIFKCSHVDNSKIKYKIISVKNQK